MSLWTELKRRNIFRVAAAYVVIGWLSLQVADIILGMVGAPEWVGKSLIALLILGFIPVLALAWVFEVGPEGIRVDDGSNRRDAGPQARRLDVITLGAVVLVMLLMVWQHLGPAFMDDQRRAPATATNPTEPTALPTSDRPSVESLSDWEALPGSIAVLPFTNRSPDGDTAYFVDGIHDDLLTELSRNPELTVISRTSVMEYRDTTKNLREIGQELGVAHVLEGAVQRAGERVRINAQLIDADTDAHLWAETFDRELSPENIFDIQTEIARAIARALGRELGTSAEAAPNFVATSNPKAFDLYLRARSLELLVAESSILERIELYKQALEHDPEFTLAMGELGREYTNLYWFTTRRDEDRQRGGEWINRALEREPDNPQLHLAQAEYFYRANLDYPAALAALDKAEQGLPGDGRIDEFRAYVQRRAGRLNETISALERAVRLDPRSIAILQAKVETHWMMGDLASARRANQRLMALPDVPRAVAMTQTYGELSIVGDIDSALDTLYEVNPGKTAGGGFFEPADYFHWNYLARNHERAADELADLASTRTFVENQFQIAPLALFEAKLAAAIGDTDRQQAQAREALAWLDDICETHPEDYRAWAQRAVALALLGQLDEAIESSDRSLTREVPSRDRLIRSEMMRFRLEALAFVGDTPQVTEALAAYLANEAVYWHIEGLLLHPAFDRHREDPDFQATVQRLRNEETRRG